MLCHNLLLQLPCRCSRRLYKYFEGEAGACPYKSLWQGRVQLAMCSTTLLLQKTNGKIHCSHPLIADPDNQGCGLPEIFEPAHGHH